MSALSRFGPKIANKANLFYQQPRHMASAAAATDPVQRLFVDKIREFKSTNKGLDATYQKVMEEEVMRLKRVYKIDDENENKERREAIASGEYQKQIVAQPAEPSPIMAAIPDQKKKEFELPQMNKPDVTYLMENEGTPLPVQFGELKPDYEGDGKKMTPHRMERSMRIKFGKNMPTIDDDKAPGRDTVNFPRQKIPLRTPPTRYHIIPESWFQFFYPKTGVTGPYIFAGSFTTFLLSKEWIVWEHDLLGGITSTMIIAYAITKFGPKIRAFAEAGLEGQLSGWENWRKGNIAYLEKTQAHYKRELNNFEVMEQLYDIRHQDVEMQLEGEYRNRIKTVYEDTKRRLNYLVALADSQRHIAHQSMVNWVISNAVASIGPKQETELLDSCIVSLKRLAGKNSNVI